MAETGAIARLTAAIDTLIESGERQAALSINLGVAVNYLAEELKKAREAEIQRASDAPRNFPARVTSTAESSSLSMCLGGPASGRVWSIQAIGVGGITPTVSAAGTCDVFQSPSDPLQTATDLTSWRDHADSLPLMGFYTTREVEVRFPDLLWLVINSPTSGQQYAGVAWIVDFLDGGYPAVEVL